jgi:hypothetical protein
MLQTEVGIERTEVVAGADILQTRGVTTETAEVAVAGIVTVVVVIKTAEAAGVKAVVGEVSKVKVTKKVASKTKNSKAVEATRNPALSLEEVPLISN